jgi:hypothetical protein
LDKAVGTPEISRGEHLINQSKIHFREKFLDWTAPLAADAFFLRLKITARVFNATKAEFKAHITQWKQEGDDLDTALIYSDRT